MGKALMAYVNRYSTVDRIGSAKDVFRGEQGVDGSAYWCILAVSVRLCRA